jgi:hypothetical protein
LKTGIEPPASQHSALRETLLTGFIRQADNPDYFVLKYKDQTSCQSCLPRHSPELVEWATAGLIALVVFFKLEIRVKRGVTKLRFETDDFKRSSL